VTTLTRAQSDTARRVERMAWPAYLRWLRRNVKAGEHGVIIGSTGSGKSWLAREVVPLFGRNIVILDGKGGDDPSLAWPGFERITRWPPPAESQAWTHALLGRETPPMRVLVTRKIRSADDLPDMRDLFQQVLRDLFPRKGRHVFALYVDEAQIVSDPREGMGLARYVGPLLRTKRYHGMSIIQATQFPTWIGRASYRETSHRWLFRLDDETSSDELGKIAGNRKALLPVLDNLRRHEFLYYNRNAQRYIVSKVGR
jgi:hypothetical protein